MDMQEYPREVKREIQGDHFLVLQGLKSVCALV